MIQTNISLHQEQHDLIKKRCEETGCSLSWIIRDALDNYFKDKVKTVKVIKKEFTKPLVVKNELPKENFPTDKCQRCGADFNKYGFCKNGHKR